MFSLVVHLCVVVSITIGQDASSSGEDPAEARRRFLIQVLCSARPERCVDFDFCPCGSNVEYIGIKLNIFNVLQLYPCRGIVSTEATYRECDTFVQQGAEYATFRIDNVKQEGLDYFYLGCFILDGIYQQPDDIARAVHGLRRDHVIGVLGPSDPEVLEIMSYVTGNFFQKIMISYASSPEVVNNPQKYPNFYSTIPSPLFFVKVVLKLLADFDWRRVALVSSRDATQLKSTEQLLHLGNQNKSKNEFTFLNSYENDPLQILQQFKDDDYRVFVANIESSKARTLFCKAISLNLTTEHHQWILPSFYDHRWWKADSNCSESNTGDCCTDAEILEAAVGTIFVGESNVVYGNSTKHKTAYDLQEKIFSYTLDHKHIEALDDDKLYLLHSRAMYAYDALILFATVLNRALKELFNTTETEEEKEKVCEKIELPSGPALSNILTDKMVEILDKSVYCGYSGYYHLANRSSLGQAWITQFQYFPNCTRGIDIGNFIDGEITGCYKESDIGHYANFDKRLSCEDFGLQPDTSTGFVSADEFIFINSSNKESDGLIQSRPYMWKGNNPWKAPTDGSCKDEHCLCLNQLGINEVVVGIVITATGIALCCVLLIVNCLLRNNRHIKASSPRFNYIIIVGSILLYLEAMFKGISIAGSGTLWVPFLCEFVKWSEHIGFSLIIVTLLARNWRIYRIFYNPRIEELKFLSDLSLTLLIIVLMFPTVIFLILWTAIDTYEYKKIHELDSCPELNLDDSITTYRVSFLCKSDYGAVWEATTAGYHALLGAFLIFLGYQNSLINSRFSQEGEFATRSMFFVLLFLAPLFSISALSIFTSGTNLSLIFWSTCGYAVLFPTILLIGLYLPKFIMIIQDKIEEKRERRAKQDQFSKYQAYEFKINQIEDLKIQLRERQSSIAIRTHSMQLSPNESMLSFRSRDSKKSPSPSPLNFTFNRKEFFDQ